MIYQLGKYSPKISASCFIGPSAYVIGKVDIAKMPVFGSTW